MQKLGWRERTCKNSSSLSPSILIKGFAHRFELRDGMVSMLHPLNMRLIDQCWFWPIFVFKSVRSIDLGCDLTRIANRDLIVPNRLLLWKRFLLSLLRLETLHIWETLRCLVSASLIYHSDVDRRQVGTPGPLHSVLWRIPYLHEPDVLRWTENTFAITLYVRAALISDRTDVDHLIFIFLSYVFPRRLEVLAEELINL